MTGKGESSPRLWIVAGPNGCGKSTIYGRSDVAEFDGSVWIINPDLLTKRLQSDEGLAPPEANLAAVQRIETWLDASIDVHQTIGVETVLSTPKYRRLVSKAKQRGFDIRLIYIYVDTLARQIERIRFRVAKGGHAVPQGKVASVVFAPFGNFRGFSGEPTKRGCSTTRAPNRSLLRGRMGKATSPLPIAPISFRNCGTASNGPTPDWIAGLHNTGRLPLKPRP